MTTYQFSTDDDDWNYWKNTVPRSKSLEQRLHELMEADADGRVLSEDTAEKLEGLAEPHEDVGDVVDRLADDETQRTVARATESAARDLGERTEPDEELSEEADRSGRAPAMLDDDPTDDLVADTVEIVSEGWDDTDERLGARRAAARAVLQHALETGNHIGKSEAVDQFADEYGVEGQSDETWWRKNIRAVLSEVGEYSNAEHGYAVDEEDVREFVEQ